MISDCQVISQKHPEFFKWNGIVSDQQKTFDKQVHMDSMKLLTECFPGLTSNLISSYLSVWAQRSRVERFKEKII